jgi:hypothetical protein
MSADPSPPTHLYHYTSAAGLKGILRENKIRLTHCAFLNDPQENLHYRRAVAAEVARLAALTKEQMLDKFEGNFRAYMERFLEELGDPVGEQTWREYMSRMADLFSSWPTSEGIHEGPWVFCLSAEPDFLSQWRAYCPGGGFAIGFSSDRLKSMAPTSNLRRCEYEETPSRAEFTARWLMGKFNEWRDSKGYWSPTEFAEALFRGDLRLEYTDAIYKPMPFRDEREWRLFAGYGEQGGVDYDIRPWGLRPFVVREVPAGAIERIYVGPSPHPDLALLTALSIAKVSHHPIEVIQSAVKARVGN